MNTARLLIVVSGLLLGGNMAAAADLADFVGSWRGTAIGEQYTGWGLFEYELRDLNVDIAATANGFEIAWVTGIESGDESDPRIVRKQNKMRFEKTGEKLYTSMVDDDPHAMLIHVWARIEDDTLNIYLLRIDEHGIYDLAEYRRTLLGDRRMLLNFSRDRDGENVRRVNGEMVKSAP